MVTRQNLDSFDLLDNDSYHVLIRLRYTHNCVHVTQKVGEGGGKRTIMNARN